MARSYFSHSIADRTGNRIANAKVNVFLSGTATAVSDMYTGASGGSAVTFLTSDARGFVSGYVDTPKALKFVVTDNTDTAYYAGAPTQLVPFDDLTYDPVYVYENPGDGETDDTTLATVVTGLSDHLADAVDAHDATAISYAGPFAPTTVEAAIDALTLTGTYAARPAAGTAGRLYYATDQGIPYRDNGSSWVRQIGDSFDIWVTDHGAVPNSDANNGATTHASTNVTAFRAAIAASKVDTYTRRRVCVPVTSAGGEYVINDTITLEHVSIEGVIGGLTGYNLQEDEASPVITGTSITSPAATFQVTDDVTNGVSCRVTLRNLVVTGNNIAFKAVGRAHIRLFDVDLYCATTGHADNAAEYVENCFWYKHIGGGLKNGSSPANDNAPAIRIVASAGDSINGISQATFKHLTPTYGGVIFDNRMTGGQAGDSDGVLFEDVVTENQGDYPFLEVKGVGAATVHELTNFEFVRCQRADAQIVIGAFIQLRGNVKLKNSTVRRCSPYTGHMFQCFNGADMINVTWDGAGATGYAIDPANPPANGLGCTDLTYGVAAVGGGQPLTLAKTDGVYGVSVGRANNADTHYLRGTATNGVEYLGPGTGAADTVNGRGGVGYMAMPVLLKAGVPADSDFPVALRVNGIFAINTSTDALYYRKAGVWTVVV